MVKDLDSIGCLTICCIQQFLSIREFKVIFLLPFFRHKCFVWKNCVWDECYRKKPGDYYLYLCELLHEEICWKRGRFVMVWFAGTSATVVSASCADFIVVLFGYWIQKPIQTDHMGGREDNATDFSSCFVQIEIRPWTPFCCIHHHATYGGSGVCFLFSCKHLLMTTII